MSSAAPRSRSATRSPATIIAKIADGSQSQVLFTFVKWLAMTNTSATLTNSEGWTLMPPSFIQFFAPPFSVPITSSTPSMAMLSAMSGISMVLKNFGARMSSTQTIMATIPMPNHTSCLKATSYESLY